MTDVKVKAYGLFKLKKKTYLRIQTIGAFIVTALLLFTLLFDPKESSNGYIRYLYIRGIFQYIPWICAGVLALEAFETYFMLRKYRQREQNSS